MGNDHFLILTQFGTDLQVEEGGRVKRLEYCKVDQDKFRQELSIGFGEVFAKHNVEERVILLYHVHSSSEGGSSGQGIKERRMCHGGIKPVNRQ